MDKTKWFLREGEIVLNLLLTTSVFIPLHSPLASTNGQSLIYVGALQGSNVDIAQDIYRNITHALHGMRPRDLLMISLKYLCGELGISRIWAISSDSASTTAVFWQISQG